jgi:hypothetical protein
MNRTVLAFLIVLSLAGCQSLGIGGLSQNKDALFGPAPLNSVALESPSLTAYKTALAATQATYVKALTGKNTPGDLLDAGIAAGNTLCRQWFDTVTLAERKAVLARNNRGVVEQFVTGAAGILQAAPAFFSAWGLATGTYEAFNSVFEAGLLITPSDPLVQAKIVEIMAQRAADLRARRDSVTFPQAYDLGEEYLRLCSYQTAQAAIKSALVSTVTTIAPTGVMRSMAK